MTGIYDGMGSVIMLTFFLWLATPFLALFVLNQFNVLNGKTDLYKAIISIVFVIIMSVTTYFLLMSRIDVFVIFITVFDLISLVWAIIKIVKWSTLDDSDETQNG